MTFNNNFEKIASENTVDLEGLRGVGVFLFVFWCVCFVLVFSCPRKCRFSCSFHKAIYDYVEWTATTLFQH